MSQRHLAHSFPSRLAALAAVALAVGVLPAVAVASAGATTQAAVRQATYRPAPGRFDPATAGARVKPSSYRAFDVDLGAVRTTLSQAPSAQSRAALPFRLPRPDGGYERFALRRTTVMEPRLAAAHPELRTYSGRSLDRPGTTVALDTTPLGLHASVRGPNGQGAWYVDPAYNKRGTRLHLSYYGAAVAKSPVHDFVERETPAIERAAAARLNRSARRTAGRTAPGALVRQRIYRLALTSDPAYAKYFGSANVLAEKVTLINRVDQVYNDDMAINLRLVNGTDKLNLDTEAKATGADGPCGAHACFDAPDPGDPTTDADDVAGQLDFCDVGTLGRNRTVLGQLIGASNYDIGHIGLGVNGGGVAFLGVVGQDYKGGGCTGLPQPEGDFFAIDYVAHEMGHQFDGNHTFNGNRYNCGFGNRNGPTSVEPGSGSSVMAYAGICRQDDLQPHSDPYFSQRSQTEILGYTGHPIQKVAEVQTVSLRGFDAAGESITLSYPGSTHAPITITRDQYDAGTLDQAVEALTGKTVFIAQWGYDPFNSPTAAPAPVGPPDLTGFQVVFSSSADPTKPPRDAADLPSLVVTSSSPGVSGFVGETAKGGVAQNGGSRVVATVNHAPRVTAPVSKIIPLRTPFKLTGSGRDADGDQLSYLWEQNDIGAGAVTASGTPLIANLKVTGPLFRVFGTYADVTDRGTLMTPSPGENLAPASATRYFPDLRQVLAGNTNARTGKCPRLKIFGPGNGDAPPVAGAIRNCFSEFLPTRAYVGTPGSKRPAMHFRLTARDGYPTGGGSSYDDVTLRISRKAGPFLVTSQARSKATVVAGTKRLVTWKVNGTQRLARNVGIFISLNGGATFNRVLASSTPNDGSQLVRFPTLATDNARIMIVARGNYFFAVNRAGFKITHR